MNTIYRKFIVATVLIILISFFIGFLFANMIYITNTKEKADRQNIEIAEEIIAIIGNFHAGLTSIESFLTAVGDLGYQVFIVNESGETVYFGEPFKKNELPEEAWKVIDEQSVYYGNDHFFMLAHFTNDVKNTVGVPFHLDGERYGLFLRPNNKMLFSEVHMILLWFFVAVSILSVSGVILFARHLIKPITKLTEATKEISRENFHYPIKIERKDEIGQLVEGFNKMQRQLQHNIEARNAFINNVSHDFQSPLMNIQGYAELLLQKKVGEHEQKEYLEVIDEEAKRLSHLTKQLLLLTSLDQKNYPKKMTTVQLDEQIKRTIRRYRWRLQEKEIEVSYKLEPVTIEGDADLLSYVWDNLISNGIKYNTSGGSIWINLLDKHSHLTVIFKDTGVGMSEETVSQVFDRFYRADSARKRDGTGLGLAIVKQIVELHAGKIEVESELGEGTTFTIQFPLGVD